MRRELRAPPATVELYAGKMVAMEAPATDRRPEGVDLVFPAQRIVAGRTIPALEGVHGTGRLSPGCGRANGTRPAVQAPSSYCQAMWRMMREKKKFHAPWGFLFRFQDAETVAVSSRL